MGSAGYFWKNNDTQNNTKTCTETKTWTSEGITVIASSVHHLMFMLPGQVSFDDSPHSAIKSVACDANFTSCPRTYYFVVSKVYLALFIIKRCHWKILPVTLPIILNRMWNEKKTEVWFRITDICAFAPAFSKLKTVKMFNKYPCSR